MSSLGTAARSGAACVSGVGGPAGPLDEGMAFQCRLLNSLSSSRKSAVSDPASGVLSTDARMTRFLNTPFRAAKTPRIRKGLRQISDMPQNSHVFH